MLIHTIHTYNKQYLFSKCNEWRNICLLLLSAKADLVGTIILNPSAMSSATLSITDDDKIYHLVSECIIRVFSQIATG